MTATTALIVSAIVLAFGAFGGGLAFVDFWSRDHRRSWRTAAVKQPVVEAADTAANENLARVKAAA